jgi:uncharacterized protein
MRTNIANISLKHVRPLSEIISEEEIFRKTLGSSAQKSNFRCKTGLHFYTFRRKGKNYFFSASPPCVFECSPVVRDIIEMSPVKSKRDVATALSAKYDKDTVSTGFYELDILVSAGLIIQNRYSTPCYKLSDLSYIKYSTLVLGLTGACNLACSYCFEHQDGLACSYCFEHQDGNAKSISMSKETASEAIDWFMDHSANEIPLTVRFFGGEPLLNPDVMEYAASYASKTADDFGKDIRFVVSTNGTLLTDDVVEIIRKYKIGVCVSIDGPSRIHDSFRRDKRGRGSFAKVKRGVDKLLKKGIDVSAQAVFTSASEDIKELSRYLLDTMGFKSLSLGYVDHRTKSPYSLEAKQKNEFNRNYVEDISQCISASGSRRFSMSGHDHILRRLFRHEQQYYGCPHHAGVSMIYVDPTGDLFPCYRLTTENDKLGNIHLIKNERVVNKRRLHYVNDRVDRNRCASCSFRYICGGTCPANFQMNKSRGKCGKKNRMELNLRLFVDLWENRRNILRDNYA